MQANDLRYEAVLPSVPHAFSIDMSIPTRFETTRTSPISFVVKSKYLFFTRILRHWNLSPRTHLLQPKHTHIQAADVREALTLNYPNSSSDVHVRSYGSHLLKPTMNVHMPNASVTPRTTSYSSASEIHFATTAITT